VDTKTLRHLCALARLELSASEEADFSAKFDRLLAFVEQVRSFDPGDSQAELSAIERLELRRDTPESFAWPEGARHDYRVPQVINFEGEA
jgi:aspartyl/glutamyl-tRNA(Asn/Gln) amidotransferase C subunit